MPFTSVADISSTGSTNPFSPIYVEDFNTLRGIFTGSILAFVTDIIGASIPDSISGWFLVDVNDTTSADNGDTIIVATDGRRWKRITDSRSDKLAAKDWATKITDTVDGILFSAKEYAQGLQAGTGGSALNWAQYTGADVPGAPANSRSAKSWAQDILTGLLGGSAKDWAQSGDKPDGVSESAKTYAGQANVALASTQVLRDQAYAALRVKTSSAAGQADGTLVSGDYFYVVSAQTPEVYELWQKGAVSPTDTGKRTPSTSILTPTSESPMMRLVDTNTKAVELVDKSGNRFIPGFTNSLQSIITDLQAHSRSYQQRDQLIGEMSRDPNLVTYTLFDWSAQPNGTLAFAPAIVRTGHNTAFVCCERRNLPGGGAGDDSVKNIIGKMLTYDRASRTVSISGEIIVSNNVPVGTLGPGSPTLVYVNTGTNAGRLYCWYYVLTSDGAGYFSSVAPKLRYSDDKGATWSAETDMSATFAGLGATIGYAFGPGHGIQLDSGRLVVPCYLTNGITSQKSFLLYSDDGGTTWTVGPVYQRTGSNECSIIDLRNGELLWLIRTTNIGKRFARVDASTLKLFESATWRNAAGTNMLGDTGIALETGCHQCENPWDSSTRKLVFTMPKGDTGTRKDQTLRVSYDYGYSIAFSYNISPGNWSDYSDITNFGPNELFCVYSYGDPGLTAANIIKASLVNIAAYMGI